MVINRSSSLRLSLFIVLTGSYMQAGNIYAISEENDIQLYQKTSEETTEEEISFKLPPPINRLYYYKRMILIGALFSFTVPLIYLCCPKGSKSDTSKGSKSDTSKGSKLDTSKGSKSDTTQESGLYQKEGGSDPPKKQEKPKTYKSTLSKDTKPGYILNLNKQDIKYEIAAEDLQATYNRSWGNKNDENLKNKKLKLTGHDGIIEKLARQLADFEKWKKKGNWDMFFQKHYDWWVFPIPYESSSYGLDYVVYKKDVKELINHIYQGKVRKYRGFKYVYLQRKASELVLESMKWWDSEKKEITGRCTRRVHTAVRRGKMMHGLLIWQQDLYKVMNALTLELEKVNLPLKSDFQKYITRNTSKVKK